MEALLVKIFATALALSQVVTTPSAVRTEFDRQRDQSQVAEILNAGCAHMLQAFELEDINIDDLIATAMDDPQAIEGAKVLRGIDFADLLRGYKQFCKNEKVDRPAVRRLRPCRITPSSGITGFPVQALSWTARAGPSPKFSRRTSAAYGSSLSTSPSM